MRKITFIEIILICILVISCEKSNNTKNSYNGERINFAYISLLMPNQHINSFLDTIINHEKKCKSYKFNKFAFIVNNYTTSDSKKGLSIETIGDRYSYNYLNVGGIFVYNQHLFICNGKHDPLFFKKSNVNILIPFNYERRIPDIDDRWSAWFFEIKNGYPEMVSYHECSQDNP